jgi:hypothetical protein
MIMSIVLLFVIYAGIAGSSERESTPSAKYEGVALDLKSNTVLYIEGHEEFIENGKRVGLKTSYRDPWGKVIVQRTVTFKENEMTPTFRTEDFRNGYLEGAEVRGDSVRLYWRKNYSSALNEKTIVIPGPAAVDAGFNNFIQRNWDDLIRGMKRQFNFGAPFALDYYGFHVYKTEEKIVGGRKQMVVQCEIDNFIIRLFVTPIVLTYDIESRRLVEYAGISNINNDKGKSHFVRIQYNPFGP